MFFSNWFMRRHNPSFNWKIWFVFSTWFIILFYYCIVVVLFASDDVHVRQRIVPSVGFFDFLRGQGDHVAQVRLCGDRSEGVFHAQRIAWTENRTSIFQIFFQKVFAWQPGRQSRKIARKKENIFCEKSWQPSRNMVDLQTRGTPLPPALYLYRLFINSARPYTTIRSAAVFYRILRATHTTMTPIITLTQVKAKTTLNSLSKSLLFIYFIIKGSF